MSEKSEQQSVRTTIVGGRPPGSGKPLGEVPRGIEILLKKSAVDPEFRQLFLSDREEAARSIELNLDPMENAMLQAIPTDQLIAIIEKTEVPEPQRRVFLGKAVTAAAILAALVGGAVALYKFGEYSNNEMKSKITGIRPYMPEDWDNKTD